MFIDAIIFSAPDRWFFSSPPPPPPPVPHLHRETKKHNTCTQERGENIVLHVLLCTQLFNLFLFVMYTTSIAQSGAAKLSLWILWVWESWLPPVFATRAQYVQPPNAWRALSMWDNVGSVVHALGQGQRQYTWSTTHVQSYPGYPYLGYPKPRLSERNSKRGVCSKKMAFSLKSQTLRLSRVHVSVCHTYMFNVGTQWYVIMYSMKCKGLQAQPSYIFLCCIVCI